MSNKKRNASNLESEVEDIQNVGELERLRQDVDTCSRKIEQLTKELKTLKEYHEQLENRINILQHQPQHTMVEDLTSSEKVCCRS
jgi:peptidoglycan hydrolase CwlO-like protein